MTQDPWTLYRSGARPVVQAQLTQLSTRDTPVPLRWGRQHARRCVGTCALPWAQVALGLLLLTACRGPGPQVVRVDRPQYSIAPCESLVLDVPDGAVPIPSRLAGHLPDRIWVSGGKGESYSLPWEAGRARYVLSSSTLRPEAGGRAFEGFQEGHRYSIAISACDPALLGESVVLWDGAVTVRQR